MIYNEVRPHTFDEVVGQRTIVKNLKNQSKAGKFMSSYILAGQYGSGKTTVGRILGLAVNCKHKDKDGNPCLCCESCKSILNNETTDIVEIDAASKSGVDGIRSLIEDVEYKPTFLDKKVYIIDEVQRLSSQAFDTLLKTLEEAPEHVMFVLCTTDFRSIPGTIRSRAAKYHFSKIGENDIAGQLKKVASEYNFSVDDEAHKLIAKNANGSLRDALSMLEQAVSLASNVTAETVKDMLGIIDMSVVFELLEHVIEADKVRCIQSVNRLVDAGKNIGYLLEDVLDILSDCIVYGCSKDASLIQNTESYCERVIALCGKAPVTRLCSLSEQFMELRMDFKRTESRSALVVAMVRACRIDGGSSMQSEALDVVCDRLNALEQKVSAISIGDFSNMTAPAAGSATMEEALRPEDIASPEKDGEGADGTGDVTDNIDDDRSEKNITPDECEESMKTEPEKDTREETVSAAMDTSNGFFGMPMFGGMGGLFGDFFGAPEDEETAQQTENDNEEAGEVDKEQSELSSLSEPSESSELSEQEESFVEGDSETMSESSEGFIVTDDVPFPDTSVTEIESEQEDEESEDTNNADDVKDTADNNLVEGEPTTVEINSGFDFFDMLNPLAGSWENSFPSMNEPDAAVAEQAEESAVEESTLDADEDVEADEVDIKVESVSGDLKPSVVQQQCIDSIKQLIKQEPALYEAVAGGSIIRLENDDKVVFYTPLMPCKNIAETYFEVYGIEADVVFDPNVEI